LRVVVVVASVTILVIVGSALELLEDEESEGELGEEDFLDRVALVSEPCFLSIFFFGIDFEEAALPELELELDESVSDSGNGTFCAMELIEESESESEDEDEDEESLSEELEAILAVTPPIGLTELEEESESDEDELEEELDVEDDLSECATLALVLTFFV